MQVFGQLTLLSYSSLPSQQSENILNQQERPQPQGRMVDTD